MVLLGGSIILKILLILVSYEIAEKYYYGSLKLTYSWLLSCKSSNMSSGDQKSPHFSGD